MSVVVPIGGYAFTAQEIYDSIVKIDCEESLAAFVEAAWHVIEPGQSYVHGWHIDMICEHLTAITDGNELEDGTPYNRLLCNVPPGTMKSLLVSVFWPAWEWGPRHMPHLRYLCASHSQSLAVRDNVRMRRLVSSEWYQKHWPHVVLTDDQNAKLKFENTATGFREAVATGSITGARGDRVIIDDPHSVESAASEAMRATTKDWFLEAVPTRLNNPTTSAIVVIMQRLHEDDVSGIILDQQLGYDHIMLPMRFDPTRAMPTKLGLMAPRSEEGELLFPERFPLEVVDRDEKVMGKYAVSGQFQQSPIPRGGGVIKRDWWQLWSEGAFPPMDFILASVDTAYTEKTENDWSALTVMGVFTGDQFAQATNMIGADGRYQAMGRTYVEGAPKVMLMTAWQKRLELHDLVVQIAETCKRLKVDQLIIENKAAGHSVAQEIRRMFGHEDFAVRMFDPKSQDKLSRLYSVQHFFEEGMVFAPDRAWAEMVMTQCAQFPKGKHDDLVDCVSSSMRHLRELGMLVRAPERLYEIEESKRFTGIGPVPLYPV